MVQNKRSRPILDATYITDIWTDITRMLLKQIAKQLLFISRMPKLCAILQLVSAPIRRVLSSKKILAVLVRVLNKTLNISAHECVTVLRVSQHLPSAAYRYRNNPLIAFFRLVLNFCCILRMQRQVCEFSSTARSSKLKKRLRKSLFM